MIKEKRSVVGKVEPRFREYDGKFGHMFVHLVSFENRDYGEYHSQSQECTKFVIGQEVSYSIEEKTFRGETEYRIKPLAEKTKDNKGSYSRWDERSERCTCVRSSSMSALELIKSGLYKMDDFEEVSKRILDWQLKNCNL